MPDASLAHAYFRSLFDWMTFFREEAARQLTEADHEPDAGARRVKIIDGLVAAETQFARSQIEMLEAWAPEGKAH